MQRTHQKLLEERQQLVGRLEDLALVIRETPAIDSPELAEENAESLQKLSRGIELAGEIEDLFYSSDDM